MEKANDQLKEFNGTDYHYKHFTGLLYTDGVHELCERYKCWWLLDVVMSYQGEKKYKAEEFQVWELIKNHKDDGSALVRAHDGNDIEIGRQEIPFTDFELASAVIWFVNGVALLPSEY